MKRRFYAQLFQQALLADKRHIRLCRLYCLLRFIDENGTGVVNTKDSDVLHFLRLHTATKSRSILNSFKELDELGYGTLQPNGYFSYKAQECVLRDVFNTAVDYTQTAVKCRLDQFSGVLRQAKSLFYAVTIRMNQSSRESRLTATREVMQEITGVHPHTQRKYESLVNVVTNFTILEPYSKKQPKKVNVLKEQGLPVFLWRDALGEVGYKGRCYIAKRLPNSYFVEIQLYKKRARRSELVTDKADHLRDKAGHRDKKLFFSNKGLAQNFADKFDRVTIVLGDITTTVYQSCVGVEIKPESFEDDFLTATYAHDKPTDQYYPQRNIKDNIVVETKKKDQFSHFTLKELARLCVHTPKWGKLYQKVETFKERARIDNFTFELAGLLWQYSKDTGNGITDDALDKINLNASLAESLGLIVRDTSIDSYWSQDLDIIEDDVDEVFSDYADRYNLLPF